ncbi:MAG TPA: type II toxin-antitoxin system ParD family antitoxin [Thermomicrobiales bacterium]|jgi:antitoxin ParD1/3/4|nr:type II toxin-antitoxin system ParD family antitoxin [Thermomicrobiales bacterium]
MAMTLTPRIEALIRQKIDTGPYRTVDEVIREALEALEERDRLQHLRAKLQVGIDQLDRGESVPFTSEWRADRLRVANERARKGETPNPDVCP